MKSGDPRKRKSLCVISSSFPLNRDDGRAAAGLFVLDFSLALSELGHKVTVVTPDKVPGGKEAFPGISVHWFSWMGGRKVLAAMNPARPRDALSMLSLFWHGARFLDRLASVEKFDQVMAMWAAPAGLLARGLKRRHGIPYTTWCLGSDIWTYGKYPFLKKVVKRVIEDSDQVYADGLQLADDVTGLSGRPCRFMASGRRLDRSPARPLDLPAAAFRFLFIGRYAPVKGVDVLLKAMAEYVRRGGRGHLYLFGGGPLDEFVHREAASEKLRDHVTAGGFATTGTVASYLNACDCLVIPSRMESIPVILTDAVRMGRPLIVSDVGDMGVLLRENPAGRVVPPDDPEALCEAMRRMASEGRNRYASGVRELADAFSIQRTASIWLEDIEAPGRSNRIKKSTMDGVQQTR